MSKAAYRAGILHFLDDPDQHKDSWEYYEDGILLVEDGHVAACGPADDLLPKLAPAIEVTHFPDSLLVPGFIDTHIHYPQTEMIAAYGEHLLEWLNTYTFPTETQFADQEYAEKVAEFFLDQLLANGTTTALVFGTSHPQSVEAFFSACEARKLRMIAGKVMMDQNAPDSLLDTADSSYADSKALIEKWHNRGRLRYAVTPRFAATSSSEQLQRAGQLLREHPGVYLHTHLSENTDEIELVKSIHRDCDHYLGSYDKAGLLGKRSVFAHCIHLEDEEWQRMAETGSAIAFCPSSNLFLGSGLFNLRRAVEKGIPIGLGTDIGAGTSFSALRTLADAYKVQKLQGHKLSPLKSFYLATLGGARCLDLDDLIGNFEHGKEADFTVIDKHASELLRFRMGNCDSLEEELFVLTTMADDRCISGTWSAGVQRYANPNA